MDGLRTGIDLGGTKIEAVALGPDGDVLARSRTATPSDYGSTLDVVSDLIAEVEAQAGASAEGLGLGTPGSVSPSTGRMRNAYNTPVNDQALDRDLAVRLGRPVRLENDANCFALAEAMGGAGRDARTVFAVILGTGVGGGVVVDGALLTGRNRIGGEWGHNPLPRASTEELTGARCDCGRLACIEAWCSGKGLEADHFRTTGSDMPAAMIASFAEAGDMAARETLDRHVDRLGRALASVVNLLDPNAIVLGGGLSNLDHLYRDLPGAMRDHVFSDVFETPIVRNQLGDSAGVIGAAWLCPGKDA